jgi:hypothetical protein
MASTRYSLFAIRLLGAVAQLGERVLCKHEVVGSIPSSSTTPLPWGEVSSRAENDWHQEGIEELRAAAYAVSADV